MEQRKGKWVTRPRASDRVADNVVHADFGGGRASAEPAQLTAREIEGLRELFRSCPSAKRALARVKP